MLTTSKTRRVLVTGGSGFIGSNFIRYLLESEADVNVINFDLLTYAGNLRNNDDVQSDDRYRFVRGDIADRADVEALFSDNTIDIVINFAAETHVDRSIENADPFVRTNVMGTQNLLEHSRANNVARFVQISTDEVYGSLGTDGMFREDSPLNPTNPYSATKASADMLVLAYVRTFGIPALITRCSNNYGPMQSPEKFIPLILANVMEDKPVPLYGDGLNRREWMYVDDHSRGVWEAVRKGQTGEVYNIGGGTEMTNLALVRFVLNKLEKPESLIQFVQDRPAHDLRYALDCSKIKKEWGWSVKTGFPAGIRSTIQWYLTHQSWVDKANDASYLTYYHRYHLDRDNTLKLSL